MTRVDRYATLTRTWPPTKEERGANMDMTNAEAALSADMHAPVVVDVSAPAGVDLGIDDCGNLAYLPVQGETVQLDEFDPTYFRELVAAL